MTPFKKNITKSIDNLNRICKTILSVYDNKTIDKMLTDNVLNQTGSDLTFNNTVAGGKFDWEIIGNCEQDGTPTPTEPIDVKVVTGDNDIVVQNKNLFDKNTVEFTLGVLEKGSTATSYVPHAEQKVTLHLGTNYLAGIGDYKDEIVGKTDDWKIVRKVGKVVFTGASDENWGNVSVLGDYYRIAINITGIKNITNNNDYQGLSNRFIKDTSVVTNINLFPGAMCQFRNTSTVYFCISQTTLADFKTWLASNNVIFYYVLATPTETPITDTTLINDLNNMYNLMGYDGQTNISIAPAVGNATPSLKVTAFVTEKEV